MVGNTGLVVDGHNSLTTSHVPVQLSMDLRPAAKGLGTLGAYCTPNELWDHVVPASVH